MSSMKKEATMREEVPVEPPAVDVEIPSRKSSSSSSSESEKAPSRKSSSSSSASEKEVPVEPPAVEMEIPSRKSSSSRSSSSPSENVKLKESSSSMSLESEKILQARDVFDSVENENIGTSNLEDIVTKTSSSSLSLSPDSTKIITMELVTNKSMNFGEAGKRTSGSVEYRENVVEIRGRHGSSSSSSSSSSSDESSTNRQLETSPGNTLPSRKRKKLSLGKRICQYSMTWATALASLDKLQQRPDCEYGENIYSVWSTDPTYEVQPEQVVALWYGEIQHHDFKKEPEGTLIAGHMTQIIWSKSRKIGVGIAKSDTNRTYVVVHYEPPGNYAGEFVRNVPPPNERRPESSRQSSQRRRQPQAIQAIAPEEMDSKKFAESCLEAHNKKRQLHGVPLLTMDSKLQSRSQKWAEKLAKKDKLEHQPDNKDGPPIGENVYYKFNSRPGYVVTGEEVTEDWYGECEKYATSYGKEIDSPVGVGHFTQVVWKDTKKFGVGVAQSKSGKWYVVANYEPAGNFIGRFAENVLPPKK
ncbi:unnamed protein product [Cyprideis torosa]|uniref:Uncharacterized protein n=1 Tax=Cyprideis torosa TaxID=163714 RepID=A0A7R8WEK4_9CRUS|nr:unnamed protein product [Cyprideis torosa]CAG0890422.1 unnamed protein product [Cyprideis torosa]